MIVLSAAALVGAAACGPLPDLGGASGTGPVCYDDSDCVPNACCGDGTGAVHVSEAPNCSNVTCSGSCPVAEVNCGCGIPVCRNSHCTVAVTTGGGCPGVKGRGTLSSR